MLTYSGYVSWAFRVTLLFALNSSAMVRCYDTFVGADAANAMTALDACGFCPFPGGIARGLETFGSSRRELLTIDAGTGHLFCNNCWRHHLKTQIVDEGQVCLAVAVLASSLGTYISY